MIAKVRIGKHADDRDIVPGNVNNFLFGGKHAALCRPIGQRDLLPLFFRGLGRLFRFRRRCSFRLLGLVFRILLHIGIAGRRGDHQRGETIRAEAPGAAAGRDVGLDDRDVAVDDVALLVPVQGQQGKDRAGGGILVHGRARDDDVIGAGHRLALALFVHEVHNGPVGGEVSNCLLHGQAVEVEFLRGRLLQVESGRRGIRILGARLRGFLVLAADRFLQFRRNGRSGRVLTVDGQMKRAVRRIDAKLPVVLDLRGGGGLCFVLRILFRRGGRLLAAFDRRERQTKLLIAHGALRNHEGLHARALIAVRRGAVGIRARRQVMDAVGADVHRLAARVIHRHIRGRLVADKVHRQASVPLGKRARREQAQDHHQSQNKGHASFAVSLHRRLPLHEKYAQSKPDNRASRSSKHDSGLL